MGNKASKAVCQWRVRDKKAPARSGGSWGFPGLAHPECPGKENAQSLLGTVHRHGSGRISREEVAVDEVGEVIQVWGLESQDRTLKEENDVIKYYK